MRKEAMKMKFNKKHLVAKVLFALGLGMYAAMPSAYALPSMGTLDNSHAATVTVDGKQMTIEGKGANNVINWASFGIDNGETVKFNDKNNYLNMVYGVDISRIYGTISGGNMVYLVNPNGILFAEGSRLDNVGSFVASTRNISSINKDEFLKNPGNVEGVLGKDNTVMDNKDYYPEYSKYVPKISVADIQLTNVPASATKIILDGPGGVILKNTELLDKTTAVMTRKNSGEIGIGSKDNQIHLTEEQQKKIILIDGDKKYQFSENPNILSAYATVSTLDDLPAAAKSEKFILTNDIFAPEDAYHNLLVENARGNFDGLGYSIKNLKMIVWRGTLGIFGNFSGDIRNLILDNIDYTGKYQYTTTVNWPNTRYTFYPTGGVAGVFNGQMSNVYVSGKINSDESNYVGGLIGRLMGNSEVRNSCNTANIVGHNSTIGGIVGGIVETKEYESYLLANLKNDGNLFGENSYSHSYYYGIGGILGGIGLEGDHIWLMENDRVQIKVNAIGLINYGNIDFSRGGTNAGSLDIGGIIGGMDKDFNSKSELKIGESYNWGKLESTTKDFARSIGDIVGRIPSTNSEFALKYSDVKKKNMYSYYIEGQNKNHVDDRFYYDSENDTWLSSAHFGIGILEEEMNRIFNKDMLGFVLYPKPGGDSSGTSNGNTGGSTGDNTGGNTGGESGGGIGENPGEVTKPDGGHVWNEKGYQDDMVFVNQVNKVIQNGTGKILEQSNGKITYEKNNGHKETKNGKTKEDYENLVERAVAKMQERNEKRTADKDKVLEKLKGTISVTPSMGLKSNKDDDFTDDAYQAFFDFLSERLADGDSTSLTKDDFASAEAIANILQNAVGQVNGTKVVNGVEYTFSSIEFKQQNNCAFNVDMKWTEKNGKKKGYTLTFTNVMTKEARNALVKYVDNLAEYGKDVTAKAAGEVVQAITGSNIAGVVTKDALINALSDDKKAKNFAKACGKDVENYIKGAPKEKLKQLISDNVAGGKEVVNAIENLLSIQK